MIKYNISHITTSIECPSLELGETIEMKMERILNNNEPITDGAPTIFQERKDGVQPEYDIRTDRFEIALEGMNTFAKAKEFLRDEKNKKSDASAESVEATKPPDPQA